MKMQSITAILILSLLTVISAEKHIIPHYQINLDLPPVERWVKVANDYHQEIQGLVAGLQTNLTKTEVTILETLGYQVLPHLGIYQQEIEGIAATVNVSPGLLTIFNVAYELSAHCTSIITRKENGTIIHGRNLDYRFLPNHLRNMTIQVAFQQNNQTIYQSMMFVSYVGVLTAVKEQLVSLSIDLAAGPTWEALVTIIEAIIFQEGKMISLEIRNILEEHNTFDGVVNSILGNVYAAPSFVIIGGMKEGGVITQDRHSTLDIWPLDGNAWYRVETNYNHWDPTPPIDDRREVAEADLNRIGQKNIDLKGIYQVLSDPPVLNRWTIYTTLMNVESGEMWGDIRYPERS